MAPTAPAVGSASNCGAASGTQRTFVRWQVCAMAVVCAMAADSAEGGGDQMGRSEERGVHVRACARWYASPRLVRACSTDARVLDWCARARLPRACAYAVCSVAADAAEGGGDQMGRSEERVVHARTYVHARVGTRVLGWCTRACLPRACAYVPSPIGDRSGSAAERARACTHHSLGSRARRFHRTSTPPGHERRRPVRRVRPDQPGTCS